MITREEMVEIIRDEHYGNSNYVEAFEKAADRILAAFDKEREREMVLMVGEVTKSGALSDPVGFPYFVGPELYGKRGQLIFRPAKGEK